MVLMYSIQANSTIRNVVFDLNWGFPVTGSDYLDGSCLMYSGNSFSQVIDYARRLSTDDAVVHSGDVMTTSTGHHKITIDLSKVNPSINKLFFALSSYISP